MWNLTSGWYIGKGSYYVPATSLIEFHPRTFVACTLPFFPVCLLLCHCPIQAKPLINNKIYHKKMKPVVALQFELRDIGARKCIWKPRLTQTYQISYLTILFPTLIFPPLPLFSSEFLEDILREKPQEADGIDSVVVVDNVPQVGPERLEKLKNVIHKIFSKFGKITNEFYPDADGLTKGYVYHCLLCYGIIMRTCCS